MKVISIVKSLKGHISYRVGMYLTMGAVGTQGLVQNTVESIQVFGLAAVALSSWELARLGYSSVMHKTAANDENNLKMLEKALDAADENDLERRAYLQGCLDIGNSYMKGLGVPKDYEKAFSSFYEGAKLGSSDCAVQLGTFYEEGKYKPKNEFLACYWYEESAFANNADGCLHLAKWYLANKGENYQKRVVYFLEKACQAGFADAIYFRDKLVKQGSYKINPNIADKDMYDYAIHPRLRRFIFKGGTSKPSEITNAYRILGFEIKKDEPISDLDLSQIRQAYHQRIKSLHPDATKLAISDNDKEKMVKLHEAYELLLKLNA